MNNIQNELNNQKRDFLFFGCLRSKGKDEKLQNSHSKIKIINDLNLFNNQGFDMKNDDQQITIFQS